MALSRERHQPGFEGLLEQPENHLGVGIGDRQGLDAELLLDLQGRDLGRRLVLHIGIDERTDAELSEAERLETKFCCAVMLVCVAPIVLAAVSMAGQSRLDILQHIRESPEVAVATFMLRIEAPPKLAPFVSRMPPLAAKPAVLPLETPVPNKAVLSCSR